MNILNVKSLRQQKYKIRVTHYRLVKAGAKFAMKGKPDLLPMHEIQTRNFQYAILAKGGKVVVELTSPNNVSVSAEAECSKKDVYVKKEGVKLALERALDKLNSNLTDFTVDCTAS